MFSLVATAACFLAAINRVNSDTIYNNLSLILVNETNSQCSFNNSINSINSSSNGNSSQIYLCLNDDYSYVCSHNSNNNNNNNSSNNNNNGTSNNISLECKLQSSNNNCHDVFINNNGYNFTLDCFSKQINTTLTGNQFNLKNVNECMYGIVNVNHSNTLLVCGIYQPLITVTTFNNTQIFQQNAKYYKFPLFGFEVNKHLVKKYGVIIIIAIVVVSCLIACCLFGMCHCCCHHMNKNKNKNYNNNNNCNNNQRMPQSANSCDV